MQKPLSAVQFTSPAPAAPARARQAPEADSGQFNQALNREMAQRQPAAPAKPSTPEAPRKEGVKSDKLDKAGAPRQASAEQRKADVKEAAKGAAAGAATAAEKQAAEEAAGATPMAEMLALVASFNQPQQAAAEVAADTLPAATAGKGMDAQLAALQTAFGKLPALAEGEAPVPQATTDGKFTSMLGKLEQATAELPEDAARPQLAAKAGAEPQTRQAADSAAIAPRAMPEITQSVRRAPEVSMPDAPVSGPLAAAVQQASLAVTQAVNPAASDKIAARVGTPAWDNQVAQKIIYMVGGEEMSASLTLNPPDLGPMQVVLNVNNDHADVMFSSAQPEVRQALEDALPKLREMMSESGISLGNTSVNDGAQQQAQEHSARASRGASAAATNGSAAEAEAQLAARPPRAGELPGLVNTFA